MKSFSTRLLVLLSALNAFVVLAFELLLMRSLAVSSWHHFTFLIISMVLLGIGTSGTALSLLQQPLMRRSGSVLRTLVLLAAGAVYWGYALAQRIPVEASISPATVGTQLFGWIFCLLTLSIPMLLTGCIAGLTLMCAKGNVALIYGANLMGSAAGVLAVLFLMNICPLSLIPALLATILLVGSVPLFIVDRKPLVIGSIILGSVWVHAPSLELGIDPFKYKSYVSQLVKEGKANLVASSRSHRGEWEIYQGESFHQVNFLSYTQAPPPVRVVLQDGHLAGAVPEISSVDKAAFLQHTLGQVAYELAPARPRVLLLDEHGALAVWLALFNHAATVTVVQEDPALTKLLAEYPPYGPSHGEHPELTTVSANSRHFIQGASPRYDLVQLVSLESQAAGSGIQGLAENYLMTVEGMKQAIQELSAQGVLFACRGIETPPRDNIKLLATAAAALEGLGISDVSSHFILYRDFLALCTLVRKAPWTAEEAGKARAIFERDQITPVYFPGITENELNQPDALPLSPDGKGDLFFYAAKELFSVRRQDFIREWPFDVRPANDNRPFFYDYFRFGSFLLLRERFGAAWITRAEIAYLLVIVTIGLTAAISLVLILLPLSAASALTGRGASNGLWLSIYFAAIGMAYMLLQISFLSRLVHLVGDIAASAAVVMTGFLLWSGAGSLTLERAAARILPRMPLLLILTGLAGIGGLLIMGPLSGILVHLPFYLRMLAGFFALGPLGYLLGFPFAGGISAIRHERPEAIPWCWGINGFASVIAPPLGLALAMSRGFTVAALSAVFLYLVAALSYRRMIAGLRPAGASPVSSPSEPGLGKMRPSRPLSEFLKHSSDYSRLNRNNPASSIMRFSILTMVALMLAACPARAPQEPDSRGRLDPKVLIQEVKDDKPDRTVCAMRHGRSAMARKALGRSQCES